MIVDPFAKLMMHVGPAKSLFEKSYFENLMEALRPGGIHCLQGMCGHQQYYINYCRRLALVAYIDHACRNRPASSLASPIFSTLHEKSATLKRLGSLWMRFGIDKLFQLLI